MYIHIYFLRSDTTFYLYKIYVADLSQAFPCLLFCIQQHHVIHSLAEAVLDTTGYKITQKTLSVEEEKIA